MDFTGLIFSQVKTSVELVAELVTVGRGKIPLINFMGIHEITHY